MKKIIIKSKSQLIAIIRTCNTNDDLNHLDVSRITDFSRLFQNSKFNGRIDKWDMSNAVNTCSMFFNATNFNGDLSKWNMSKVENFMNMFTLATSFEGKGLANWNISSSKTMWGMFAGAKAFNEDVEGWSVKDISNTSFMFKSTPCLESKPTWAASSI